MGERYTDKNGTTETISLSNFWYQGQKSHHGIFTYGDKQGGKGKKDKAADDPKPLINGEYIHREL